MALLRLPPVHLVPCSPVAAGLARECCPRNKQPDALGNLRSLSAMEVIHACLNCTKRRVSCSKQTAGRCCAARSRPMRMRKRA